MPKIATYGYSERVAYYIREFAAYLELPEEHCFLLGIRAFLHDIGKSKTPREIRNKRGGLLNEQEWAIMQKHPLGEAEIPPQVRHPFLVVLHHQKT